MATIQDVIADAKALGDSVQKYKGADDQASADDQAARLADAVATTSGAALSQANVDMLAAHAKFDATLDEFENPAATAAKPA